jgi:hypothetical protein
MSNGMLRSRWAAIGAAIAVALGGGGLGLAYATASSGERAIYLPINPCRLTDTRPAPDTVGARTTPLGTGETYTLAGWGNVGNCTLPNGTAGLALNVTAVGATSPTYLTLWPSDGTRPLSSNLNPWPGQPPTPNAVNVDLSPTGQFNIFNLAGNVDVIIDVVGIYDDHNHDDRYYTKTDLQAELAALKAANATQDAYIKTVLLGTAPVPSGQTVSGYGTFDHSIVFDNEDVIVAVQLPGRTAAPLTDGVVNFAVNPDVGDGDAACTGTTAAPTAPAGKVCIYLGPHLNVDGLLGWTAEAGFESQFFLIQGFAKGAQGDLYFRYSWAYRAP